MIYRVPIHSLLPWEWIGKCCPRDSISWYTPKGPRDCHWASPLGNLSVLEECISQYIPPRGSVRIQYIYTALFVLNHLNLSSDFMSRWKGKKQEVQETVEMMVEMQRSAEKWVKNNVKATIFPTSVFQPTPGTSSVLPADWEERKDTNGKVYFFNQTGEILCNGECTVNIIVNTRELQFTLRVRRWCKISPNCSTNNTVAPPWSRRRERWKVSSPDFYPNLEILILVFAVKTARLRWLTGESTTGLYHHY